MVTDGSTFSGRSSPTTPKASSGCSSSPRRRRPRRGRAFGSSQPICSASTRPGSETSAPHRPLPDCLSSSRTTSAGDRAEPEHEQGPPVPAARPRAADQASSWQRTESRHAGDHRGRARRRLQRGRVARLRREHQDLDDDGRDRRLAEHPRRRGARRVQHGAAPGLRHGRGRADTDQHDRDVVGSDVVCVPVASDALRSASPAPRSEVRQPRPTCSSARTRAPRSGRA